MLLAALPLLADQVFLATYFLDNGQKGAYVAISHDGYRFEPLMDPNVPILAPKVGKDRLMRDACLLLGPDKRWHMVWTSGWWDRGVGIAHSSDLANWSEQEFLPVMEGISPDAVNAWAPEIAYDDSAKRYLIFWSSTLPGKYPDTDRKDGDLGRGGVPLNHRYYVTTTRDFKTYSKASLLWDPGFNCIDATLLKHGADWLLFGKDETKAPSAHKFIFAGSSKSAQGPFKMICPHITGDYWAEGPSAVKLGEVVRVYFDRYIDDRWGAVESADLMHWRDVSDRVHMVPHARHGTVVLASRQFVTNLRSLLRRRSE